MANRKALGGTLVLGGGFAGGYVARLLGKRGATIVSPENFMLYTPMLPEAASGTLEPRHVVVPLRQMCPHAELLLGRATEVDADRREVAVETENGTLTVSYDELVVALGAISRALPIPGLADHALGFKSLADAIQLRNHVLRRLEAADAATSAEQRDRELTFLFIGAGYAGVEALAELSDLVRDAMRYYPGLRESAATLGAGRCRGEDPARDPDPARRLRGARARRARRRHSRHDDTRVRRGPRRDPLRRQPAPDEHRRLDCRRPREPGERTARPAARRPRARAGRSHPPRRGGAPRLGARRRSAGPERGDARTVRPPDLPARPATGSAAGQEPLGPAPSVPLPHARPGGDARSLQGDRRCARAANSAGFSAGSSPAPTTCTSCRCLRENSGSWPTGRPRSSFAGTSPSSGRSATRRVSTPRPFSPYGVRTSGL